MRQKYNKYVKNKESEIYTYKNKKPTTNKNTVQQYQCVCGQIYKVKKWFEKHEDNCLIVKRQKNIAKANLPNCYVFVPCILQPLETVSFTSWQSNKQHENSNNNTKIVESDEKQSLENENILNSSLHIFNTKQILEDILT